MLGILLISFAIFVILGIPMAFAMGLSSLLALLFGGKVPLILITQRFVVALDSFPLMAVPLFILTGQLMNTGGVTQRIIAFANVLVGHIKGGLSHVNVLASMIFAGVSGSATADSAGIGSVLIPAMVKDGYEEDWAVGITAASSTVGPIIPPSILMIIYGSMTQLSIGKLFLAGLIPGVLIGGTLILAGYLLAIKRHYKSKKRASSSALWKAFKEGWPPLLAPLIILGGITGGVFTATEAGVIAATYAFILGIAYREITVKNLFQILLTSAMNTTVIMFILACASSFGWILAREQFPQRLVNLLLSVSENPHIVLFLIVLLMLIIGLFIEGMAAFIIFIPVFVPIVNNFGYDPIHFAIVIVLCIMIGAVTPPVGILLYIACGVANVPLRKVTGLIWIFVLPMILVLLLVAYYPSLSTYLPTLFIK